MSSPDRRRLLLTGLAALAGWGAAGCGWRPALGDGAAGAALHDRVRIVTPTGRLGFAVAESLETRLGRGGAAADHVLEADLAVTETGLAITAASAITRFVVRGESRWRLTGPLAGPDGLSGTARSTTGYSATASLYATRAARRDAEAQVARDLGERIAAELLARLPDAAPAA